MRWKAESLHEQFVSGTLISLYRVAFAPGIPAFILSPNDSIALRFPDGTVKQIGVVSVAGSTAVFQTPDGTQWEVEEVAPDGLLALPASPAGFPTRYWKVK